jgi:chaperonin GroES
MAKAETKQLGIKPLSGYLLVEPSSAETTTASGIVLPDSAQEKPAQGTVVAVGAPLVLDNGQVIASPVSLGDKVVYKKWGGDEIKVKGVEYKLVKFDDLMALLED